MRNRLTDLHKWLQEKVAPPTPAAPSSHILTPAAEDGLRPERPTDNRLPNGSTPLHQLPSSWGEMTDEGQPEEQGSVWARIMCGRGTVGRQVLDARVKEKLRTPPEAINRLNQFGIRLD
jgi:hypothetical protein